jgi:hypothetical protein
VIRSAARQSLGRWMVLFGAALMITLLLTNPDGNWRYEMAHATDVAGVYLLLMLPIWTGIAAWDAQQMRLRIDTFLPAVHQPGRAVLSTFAGTAFWAVVLHAMVLCSVWATALASGALGRPLILLAIVQFVVPVGFIALGAVIGWRFPTPLVAPAVAGALLLLNVLAISVTNIRQLTGLGEGGFDYNGQAPGRVGLAAQGLVGVLLVAMVLIGSRVGRDRLNRTYAITGIAAAVAAFFTLFVITPTTEATAASANTTCAMQRITVCTPRQYGSRIDVLTLSADDVASTIADMGGTTPDRLLLDVAGNPYRPGEGILVLSPADVRDLDQINEAIVAAFSHPYSCDLVNAPTALQFAVFDTIYGLIHARRGTVPANPVPQDLVDAISALPPDDLRTWFAATMKQMWACELDQIRLPDGIDTPDRLRLDGSG